MRMNHKEALTKQVYTFASELYAYGVREVVISPGSRSTPLAIAFEAHPNIKTWIHPDEPVSYTHLTLPTNREV